MTLILFWALVFKVASIRGVYNCMEILFLSPDFELNREPFGSQASTQSTEPHLLGLEILKNEHELTCAHHPALTIGFC